MEENWWNEILANAKILWKFIDNALLGENLSEEIAKAQIKTEQATLGRLPQYAVYKRTGGKLWMKLNPKSHVPVVMAKDHFVGDGLAEALDPKEKVERL